MKLVFTLLTFFAVSSALADNVVCKQLDANVVAEVVSIKPLEGTGLCRAELSFDVDKAVYAENRDCPLSHDEVIARGVTMKCDSKAGDQVSGLLYRSVFDVQIYLYRH